MAITWSAISSVLKSGTLETTMPRSVARATSMRSVPLPMREMRAHFLQAVDHGGGQLGRDHADRVGVADVGQDLLRLGGLDLHRAHAEAVEEPALDPGHGEQLGVEADHPGLGRGWQQMANPPAGR